MTATQQNIIETIQEAEVLADVDTIQDDIALVEQGIDSLDIVNIYLLLEEKFDIKIPDEDLGKVKTINQIIEYINTKKA